MALKPEVPAGTKLRCTGDCGDLDAVLVRITTNNRLTMKIDNQGWVGLSNQETGGDDDRTELLCPECYEEAETYPDPEVGRGLVFNTTCRTEVLT